MIPQNVKGLDSNLLEVQKWSFNWSGDCDYPINNLLIKEEADDLTVLIDVVVAVVVAEIGVNG